MTTPHPTPRQPADLPPTESAIGAFWRGFKQGLRSGWRDCRQFLAGFWRVMTLRDPAWPPGINSKTVLFASVITFVVMLIIAIVGDGR